MRPWTAAFIAAGVAWAVKLALPATAPALRALLVLGPFSVVYLGATLVLGVADERITRKLSF